MIDDYHFNFDILLETSRPEVGVLAVSYGWLPSSCSIHFPGLVNSCRQWFSNHPRTGPRCALGSTGTSALPFWQGRRIRCRRCRLNRPRLEKKYVRRHRRRRWPRHRHRPKGNWLRTSSGDHHWSTPPPGWSCPGLCSSLKGYWRNQKLVFFVGLPYIFSTCNFCLTHFVMQKVSCYPQPLLAAVSWLQSSRW